MKCTFVAIARNAATKGKSLAIREHAQRVERRAPKSDAHCRILDSCSTGSPIQPRWFSLTEPPAEETLSRFLPGQDRVLRPNDLQFQFLQAKSNATEEWHASLRISRRASSKLISGAFYKIEFTTRSLSVEIQALRVTDKDAGGKHQSPTHRNLDCCGNRRGFHIAVPDPRDDCKLCKHDTECDEECCPKARDEKRKRVAYTAERCHCAANQATDQRMTTAGEATVV
jgi:hypothetical protein